MARPLRRTLLWVALFTVPLLALVLVPLALGALMVVAPQAEVVRPAPVLRVNMHGRQPPDTIVYGVVTEGPGDPAAGVVVTAQLWPNNEVLASGKKGEQVHLFDVGTYETEEDGYYVITLDPAEVPPKFREPDGSVQIMVMVGPGPDMKSWEFTASPAQHRTRDGRDVVWSTSERDGRGTSAPKRLNFDLGKPD